MTTTTDRTGRRAWVLVDLDVHGRVFRFTDAPTPQDVTDLNSRTFRYEPGLQPQTMQRAVGGQVDSMSFDVNAAQEISWAKRVAQGAVLEYSSVTVRRWYEGQLLDTADVFIRGKLVSPEYGNSTEPLSFTVKRLRRQGGVFPSSNMVIGPSTFPVTSASFVVDPAALGAWYPMPFGVPTGAMTPAYFIEYDSSDLANCKLIIAGGPVEASTVTLWDVKGNQSMTRTVKEMQDLLGRTISYVDFTSSPSFAPLDGREHMIAWDQGGGGLTYEGELLEGAGDVLAYFLREWTDVPVDWGQFESARAALNGFALAFVRGLDQQDTWAIIEDILDLLPIDWIEGVDGDFPMVWRLDATKRDARGPLIDCTRVTGRYTRVGRLRGTGEDIRNSFTLQYNVDGSQLRPSAKRTISAGEYFGGAVDLTDTSVLPDILCRISQNYFGDRPERAESTEMVASKATADRILTARARLKAIPRRALTVGGDRSLDDFNLNDVALVTATDLELSEEPALVRSKAAFVDGSIELDLLLLDAPLIKQRATA